MSPTAPDVVDAFLDEFFGRDDRNYDKFLQLAKPRVLSTARYKAYGLAEDQLPEVFGEVCLRTLSVPSSAFLQKQATGRQFLYGLTLNAIRKVRREYGLIPLARSSAAREDNISQQFVSSDDSVEVPVQPEASDRAYDAEILAAELLRLAKPSLRLALVAESVYGLTGKAAADLVGWSRFKLQREKSAFARLLVRSEAQYKIYNLANYSRPMNVSSN